MKKIIGGEFAIRPFSLEFTETPTAVSDDKERIYSTGRSALYAILKDINDGCKILLPDYLCASITRTVAQSGGVWLLPYRKRFLPESCRFDFTDSIRI